MERKAPGMAWIRERAHSKLTLRRAVDEARLQRDEGRTTGGVTYRLTPTEYQTFVEKLREEAVRQGTIKQYTNIENL